MRTWTKIGCGQKSCKAHYMDNEGNELFYDTMFSAEWILSDNVKDFDIKILKTAHVDEVQGAIDEANEILDKL